MSLEPGNRIRRRCVGVDPGLRQSGICLVRDAGPGLPELLARETLKLPRDSDPREMAEKILRWIRAADQQLIGPPGEAVALVAIEPFSHRPYLKTADGHMTRPRDAVPMARLVERVSTELEIVDRLPVVEVSPEDSKAGWSKERARRHLPRDLKNGHERDSFLQAAAGLALTRPARRG